MSQNGFYNNTLRIKAEPPEYFAEQLRRRPRRQRVTALFLVLLSGCLLAWGFVDLPRANTVATVVSQNLQPDPEFSLDPELNVTFVLDGATYTASVSVEGLSADQAATTYPVGARFVVHGSGPTPDDLARAEIPTDHPVAGPVLAVLALVGAGLLWLAARRNDRKLEEAWRRKAPWKLQRN